MKRVVSLGVLVLLAGCAKPAVPHPMGYVVEGIGQCVENGKGATLSHAGHRVSYHCVGNTVLLGDAFSRGGAQYIRVGQIRRSEAQLRIENMRERRVVRPIASPCELKGERGNCRAYFKKYHFNAESKRCSEFVWGGCGGVVPFHTLEACRKQCEE